MRQYIGARYVPTFADPLAWDNSHSYEALMIVDYMGDTYTSKKPVPPGIAITNTDYWVMTGSFNSQLNELRQEIEELTRPRRFLYIGDSYNEIVGAKWTDIVDAGLGVSDSVVMTTGGYGFIAYLGQWQTQLEGLTIPEGDNTITDILICGGANDAFMTLSNIIPAITSFCSYVRGRFENLKNIYLGFAGNSFYTNAQRRNFKTAYRAYLEGAKINGMTYLHGIETTLCYAPFMQNIGPGDYIHPNVDGVRELGRNIVQCVTSGKCQNSKARTGVTYTINDTKFVSGTFSVGQGLNDNILTVHSDDISLTTGASSVSGIVTIGSCDALKSSIPYACYIPVVVTYGTTVMNTAMYSDGEGNTDLVLLLSSSIPANTAVTIKAIDMTIDCMLSTNP